MREANKLSICDGKYTIVQEPDGRTKVLRYGDEWRDATGDNVIGGLAHELTAANARIRQFEDCLENAWSIIANVSGGDWSKQHSEWRDATIDWRNNSFHPLWSQVAKRRSMEAKEATP